MKVESKTETLTTRVATITVSITEDEAEALKRMLEVAYKKVSSMEDGFGLRLTGDMIRALDGAFA